MYQHKYLDKTGMSLFNVGTLIMDDMTKFLIAFEAKWRSRVNTLNPYDADPYSRVGRNEMAVWCRENGLAINPLLDAEKIQPGLDKLLKRLKREFPDERWSR